MLRKRLEAVLAGLDGLQSVQAREFDGEESDGTPRSFRRSFVSRRELVALLQREFDECVPNTEAEPARPAERKP